MAVDPRLIDDLARRLAGSVPESVAALRRDLEQNFKGVLSGGLARLLKRIIYMGGLGELGDNLSEHLRSRQKVAEILESGKARTTVLRAANIVGAGGAPFEMLRHMVERLPVMICPRWIDTRGQPIAVDDVVETCWVPFWSRPPPVCASMSAARTLSPTGS